MSILANMINDVYNILIQDEKLLRLLYYPPTSRANGSPDPLDDSLKDIVVTQDLEKPPTDEYKKMWGIIKHRILKTSKSDDMEDNRLCRIYIYAGKSRPSVVNGATTRQEIVVDVFTHNSYDVDLRINRIGDRVHQLLMYKDEEVTGLGEIDYSDGYDFEAPKEYQAYRHMYEKVRSKK